MLSVLLTLRMPCGCTEALVDDGYGGLVNCTVDACRGKWWCECADPQDPREYDHAEALLILMGVD
jgi:hypothetical protein